MKLPLTVKVSTKTETEGALGGWKAPKIVEAAVFEVKCSSRPLKTFEVARLGLTIGTTVHEFFTDEFWPGDHENTVSWVDLEGTPRKGKQLGPKMHSGMGKYTNNTLINVEETGSAVPSG